MERQWRGRDGGKIVEREEGRQTSERWRERERERERDDWEGERWRGREMVVR